MKTNLVKICGFLFGCTLIFNQNIQAQGSLKTSVPYRINWLIRMAQVKEAAAVADSIEAKGYKPISVTDFGNTPGGFISMFKIAGSTNYYGLMSNDGNEVTACGYFTSDEEIYKQIIVSIPEMGFKTTSIYQTGPGELAFSKENILLVLTTNMSKNKNTYILTASRIAI